MRPGRVVGVRSGVAGAAATLACGAHSTARTFAVRSNHREASLPSLDIPSSQELHPEFIPYGTFSMMAAI
jgi:hypothetical protein